MQILELEGMRTHLSIAIQPTKKEEAVKVENRRAATLTQKYVKRKNKKVTETSKKKRKYIRNKEDLEDTETKNDPDQFKLVHNRESTIEEIIEDIIENGNLVDPSIDKFDKNVN